jgi:MoxR-like ATPase
MGQDWQETLESLRHELGQVIRGRQEAVELLLTGVLAGGHVLLEDVPGVGKTTLAKALAKILSVDFARVQFTPDLLPSDILGCQVLDPTDASLSFRRGPVFTNVLLADEINRASPRTQSALLEAMNECQVSIEGTTYHLPAPFFVLATQNPVDFQGIYPLPEAQLDRFLLRFGVGYPAAEDELEILYAHQSAPPLEAVEPIAGAEDLLGMMETVRRVVVKREVATYLLQLVEASRTHSALSLGVSTRGALAYFRAGQARSFLCGRSYMSPDDLQHLAIPVLAHRLQLTSEARYGGHTASSILNDIVADVPVPL